MCCGWGENKMCGLGFDLDGSVYVPHSAIKKVVCKDMKMCVKFDSTKGDISDIDTGSFGGSSVCVYMESGFHIRQ